MAEIFYKYGNPVESIKDVDVKNRLVKAYYCSYNTIDSDGDIISPGAYSKSINERGPKSNKPRIKHLFNHWEACGVLQELGEDSQGGWFVSKIGRHTLGRDVLQMYEDGLITEHSHGFQTINADNEIIEGRPVRRIKEAILWEVTSLDKWGANENTPVIKSIEDRNNWIRKLDKLQKIINNGNYTDETFEVFEIQIMQIKSLLQKIENSLDEKPYKGWHSARIVDPDKFQEDSFRRKELDDGIVAIMGKLKGETTMTIQAIRFDAKKFTVAEAKQWLKDHNFKWILFEEAEEEEKIKRPVILPTLMFGAGGKTTLSKININMFNL